MQPSGQEGMSGSSSSSSTGNINASSARDQSQALGRALFWKTMDPQSENLGIQLVDTQLSRASTVDVSKKGLAPRHVEREIQSVTQDSDVVKGDQRDERGQSDYASGGMKNSRGRSGFSRGDLLMRRQREVFLRGASLWYKKIIIQGILRQRDIPSTKDGRHIDLDVCREAPLIDERTGNVYINNSIRSSRYTIWTFLPYQLWFQFSKVANFFFLITAILQLIPGLSTTGSFTTALPLLFFLCFSICREGYDDFRRYKLDKVENKRLARALYGFRPNGAEGKKERSFIEIANESWSKIRNTSKKEIIEGTSVVSDRNNDSDATLLVQSGNSGPHLWMPVKWLDLKVGDIIELKRDDQLPADIVLLYADGRDGVAYIETMALDGETNLKSKRPLRVLAEHCGNPEDISNCHAHFVVEDPNFDLYDFNGRVIIDGETLPLTPDNVVYRGSTLRNTATAIGIIINTGEECKIRMNASRNPKTKAPAVQAMTNKIVIFLMMFLILLSIGCTAGYVIWVQVYANYAWYLTNAGIPLDDIFIAFVIEFNNLIPLALYVSLEIIKFAQFLLLQDVEMYDPVSDTPMVSNTQTIFEDLGQISYIFSDKTGTLTENIMRFRKMSVAGTAWLHNIDVHKAKIEDAKDNTHRATMNEKAYQNHRQRKSSVPTDTGTSVDTRSPLINDDLRRDLQAAQSTKSLQESMTVLQVSRGEPGTDRLLKYLQESPSSIFARKVQMFLLSLALCHTCFPEIQKNGDIDFQAASPDELALVEAAQELGYVLIDRNTQSITLLTYPSGPDSAIRETYEVLDVIEFSSKRKRMSVVVKFPDGRICIVCKGADSVIQPRLKLASLALQKKSQIERQHSQRMEEEAEEALLQRSGELHPRSSLQGSILPLNIPGISRKSTDFGQASTNDIKLDPIPSENALESGKRENDAQEGAHETSQILKGSNRRHSLTTSVPGLSSQDDHVQSLIRDAELLDDAGLFEHCFKHIDEFASDGLRTLLYGYRFIDEEEHIEWKKIYNHAATSLVNRQEMIESAAEMIEQDFDLAGATAIEDKLQKGVPETIEKLQRASIKIWMLTGDKRETAINIAHSAHICKSYSQVIILDHETGDMEKQVASALFDITNGKIAHSVIVINGQMLVGIERNQALAELFYKLLLSVDSVICCRASPSQKATMVKEIRRRVRRAITLAIGDGGNDIAMIQEAHVGVGISGKEGLQAARVADYSIAQFRFLQRLLLVHGHWNYVRTSNYILFTFWKEMMFYSVQVLYQRWNGYTGPSLYENDSLIVWNTLFTSLPVMLPGIFEQDLSAATLLAVPELYTYGQERRGFTMKKYALWTIKGAIEAQIIYFMMYGLYGVVPYTDDQGLFAIGDMAFSVCVVVINVKLLILQYHYKTWVPLFGAFITIFGWWLWNFFLNAVYTNAPGPYTVYHAFTDHFGKNPAWWAVLVGILAALIVPDLAIDVARRRFWPSSINIWQELEQDKTIRKKLVESGGEGGYGLGREGVAITEQDVEIAEREIGDRS